jgi:hypothetical protein
VSNNPYHLATLRSLGRRFSLNSGLLGVVVIKRSADVPTTPDLLPRMRRELRREGSTGSPSAGVVTWATGSNYRARSRGFRLGSTANR